MQFGGRWTETKLEILEAYLNAYTTALKRTPFRLIYIDAFAGTGRIELQEDGETIGFLRGSTERALRVCDKPFDELMFIERHPARCAELEKLRLAHPKRRIAIEQGEVNSVLGGLRTDWSTCRGVLFLDPFATEVEWTTLKRIASFNALDTWILFKENLAGLFGDRFLRKSKRLVSSMESPLFEFIFCVGNPHGIPVAKRIANHILDKM